jgi:molybdenum cofactor cytidylyltransferase
LTARRTPARFVTGLVLAAGGSTRLGRPKQLLPFGEGTLLGHVLDLARRCPFQQRLCVLGSAAAEVRGAVMLEGFDVLENTRHGEGCGSSIALGLNAVDERAEALVLLLGDQPGVLPSTVAELLERRRGAPIAVCAYEDGRGHPLAFGRELFAELASLHGDKAVWKLIDQRPSDTVEVRVAGPIPRDIDTWEDYLAATAG